MQFDIEMSVISSFFRDWMWRSSSKSGCTLFQLRCPCCKPIWAKSHFPMVFFQTFRR